MQELEGTRLKKLDFELQKKGDIYSLEGPFLSHFRDERGFDYLMNWVDINNFFNRWQLIKVNNEQLNKYFSKKISLLQLVKATETGAVHFIDIDSKAIFQNIWVVATDKIPVDYSPQENSFFDVVHSHSYALELAMENKQILKSNKESFIQKAIKQLFGTKTTENNIFSSYGISSPWSNEPNTIDEMTTIRVLYFPLLLHYHQNKDNLEIRNLIATHSQAYTNSYICKTYIKSLNTVIFGNDIDIEHININQFFEALLESTNELVIKYPVYKPLYNDWISTIGLENENIGAFHKYFDIEAPREKLNILPSKKKILSQK